MSIKVGLAQIDVSFGQTDENFERVEKFVAQAAKQQVDVVVFPEMWNTGYALTELDQLADRDGAHTKELLSKLAKQYHVNIVGGSVSTNRNGHFYNTSYIFDSEGQLVSQYDKAHLFGLMHEEQFITAGAAKNQFTLAGVLSAGVICYDIRFPEWLRTNALGGAKIIYVSAEWPEPRIKQWETLLAARAIENQAFVVAVNRVGNDPDNHFSGHSQVIDPLGNVVLDAGEDETLVTTEFDFDQIDQVRGSIPVFDDRRPELYE